MRLGVIGGTAMTSLATDEIEVSRSDNIVAQTDYGPVPILCVKSGSNELFSLKDIMVAELLLHIKSITGPTFRLCQVLESTQYWRFVQLERFQLISHPAQ